MSLLDGWRFNAAWGLSALLWALAMDAVIPTDMQHWETGLLLGVGIGGSTVVLTALLFKTLETTEEPEP